MVGFMDGAGRSTLLFKLKLGQDVEMSRRY
jgi:hypothetical protein